MKYIGLKLVLTSVVFCLFAGSVFAAVNNKASVTTIYLVGDSTVCKYGDDTAKYDVARSGWGENIDKYFINEVKVNNLAISGRSARSFIYENNYQELKDNLKNGDYLFIQFGHNDEKQDIANLTDTSKLYRHASPLGDETLKGSYQYYLYEYYIKLAREEGAIPVLVTPIARRLFDSNGKVIDSHYSEVEGENTISYDNSMRALARKQNVTLIDLNKATVALYNQLGNDGAGKLHAVYNAENTQNGVKIDNTHLNRVGSLKVAGLVTEGISKSNLPLKKYLDKYFIAVQVLNISLMPCCIAGEKANADSY